MDRIKRLRKIFGDRMVRFLRCEGLCHACPWGSRFHCYGGFVKVVEFDHVTACQLCVDFINLSMCAYRLSKCPCSRLGSEGAQRQARIAVKQWLKGTHKWQKEEMKK